MSEEILPYGTPDEVSPAPPKVADALAALATEIRRVLSAGWPELPNWLEERLTVTDAARLLGMPVSSLYKLNGTSGPCYSKLASTDRGPLGPAGGIRYRRADLLSWLEARKVDPVERGEVRRVRHAPRRRQVPALAALRGRTSRPKTNDAPVAAEASRKET